MRLVDQIRGGELDDDLGDITEAIAFRKNTLKRETFFDLNVGDKVVFNSTARPGYLKGTQATITGKKRTKVTVELDETVGKFQSGLAITSPVTIFDLVEPS